MSAMNQTQIIGEEGEHADHLTTTTTTSLLKEQNPVSFYFIVVYSLKSIRMVLMTIFYLTLHFKLQVSTVMSLSDPTFR